MTDPVARLAIAEADEAAARRRLQSTLAALQERLAPGRLARDTKRDLSGAGQAAARRTADTARRYPGALAGLVALGGLFLARHRIVALLRRPAKATRDAGAS